MRSLSHTHTHTLTHCCTYICTLAVGVRSRSSGNSIGASDLKVSILYIRHLIFLVTAIMTVSYESSVFTVSIVNTLHMWIWGGGGSSLRENEYRNEHFWLFYCTAYLTSPVPNWNLSLDNLPLWGVHKLGSTRHHKMNEPGLEAEFSFLESINKLQTEIDLQHHPNETLCYAGSNNSFWKTDISICGPAVDSPLLILLTSTDLL